ncbi:YraN family protein, partial [Nonomuraea sp. NPDC001684]
MAPKDELGKEGEHLAAIYLEAKGMTILERNWRCRRGEIDIIALDGHPPARPRSRAAGSPARRA